MLMNKEEIIQELVSFFHGCFLEIEKYNDPQVNAFAGYKNTDIPKRAVIRMTEATESKEDIPLIYSDGTPVPEEIAVKIRKRDSAAKKTVRNWNLTSSGAEESDEIFEPVPRSGIDEIRRYHRVPVYEFRFVDDQEVLLDANVGPLYGWGIAVEINDDGKGNGKLGKVERRWVS